METNGINEKSHTAKVKNTANEAPGGTERSGDNLLRRIKERVFGKKHEDDPKEVLKFIASEGTGPEKDTSKKIIRSAYNEAFVKQLKDANPDYPEEAGVLQDFLDGIDRQGIDNIHAHQQVYKHKTMILNVL